MATPNSMEIVEEGPLESISRPTSGTPKYAKAGESTSRPTTADRSFVMEMLPADVGDDEFEIRDSMTLEDVIDSDVDIDDTSVGGNEDLEDLQIVNARDGSKGHQTDDDVPISSDSKRSGSADSTKGEIDPKIAKGLEKIKKLDSVLEQVAKKEKDVKEDRRRVEKELRLELRGLLEEKSSLLKRVGNNVQHILALCEADESDEGKVESQSRTSEFSPVFQTQIDFEENILSDREKCAATSKQTSKHSHESSQGSARESSRRSSANEKGAQRKTKASSTKSKDGKKSKSADKNKQQNFIERNIKLASHAADVIALTEDERKRLDDLLSDESDLFAESNPFSSISLPMRSTGYSFEPHDSESLLRIDARLKELIPDEDYNSICLTWRSDGTSAESFTSGAQGSSLDDDRSLRQDTVRDNVSFKGDVGDKSVHSNVDDDDDCCGEHILQERKKSREAQQRLVTIEKQLKDMQQYDDLTDTPLQLISNELLRQLLDVDSRATSTAMSIKDVVSGRLSVSDADIGDLTSCASRSEYDHDVSIEES